MARTSLFKGKILKPAAKENPHREGSQSFKTYDIFLAEHKRSGYKGVTIEKCQQLKMRMNTIRADIKAKLILVSDNA